MDRIMLGGPQDSFDKADKGLCPRIGRVGLLKLENESSGVYTYRCDICDNPVYKVWPLGIKKPN